MLKWALLCNMKAGRFLEVKEVDKLYFNRNMTDILLPRVLSLES